MVKTIILGLDGADLDIIKNAGNKLPNLNNLLKGGAHANFNSTIPPITIPAWISMFTGKNPAKIRTLSFRRVVKSKKGYTSTIAEPTWRGAMLWDYLSKSGYKVAVINVPGTYPAWKVNGIMISGFPSPKISTYPPKLADELPKDEFGEEDVINVFKKLDFMRHQTEKIIDLTLFLAEKKFDLVISVLRITDVYLHHTSKLSELLEAYKIVDNNLTQIVNLVEGDYDYLFIVSDHGAKPVKRKFYSNTWLSQENYLKFEIELSKKAKFTSKIANFLASKGMKKMVWTVFYYLQKGRLKSVRKLIGSEDVMNIIDWDKTSAFMFGLSGVDSFELWIIDKSRETEILRKLSVLKDGANNVVKAIFKSKELYGDCPNDFPDYIVQLNDGYSNVLGQGVDVFTPATGFIHRREGTFLAYGQDVKKGYYAGTLEITDLTPTILHLFEVSIPKETDGRVVKEIFNESSEFVARDIKYEDEKEEIKRRIHKLISTGKI